MRNRRTLFILTALVLMMVASPALAAEETGGSPLDALGINNGFLLAQWINFGFIFLVLTFVLWRPITNMLDARSAKIAKGLEDAAAAAAARRNAEVEAEKIIQQARNEAQTVVAAASGRGEEVGKGIEAEARKEADKIREEGRAAAQAERNAELAGLRDQVVAISVAMTERLIGETLTDAKQKKLVSDFLTNLPAGAKDLSGDVVVTSAMPLDEAEQANVQKALSKATSVTFLTDPKILGGLVVRSGDKVVDGSVRSNLNSMSSRLG